MSQSPAQLQSSHSAVTASSPSSSIFSTFPFPARLLLIVGDQSGVGKSSIAMGLLSLFISHKIYLPSELAYIKPCTQCQDYQLISKYCQSVGIDQRPVGPIVFYSGYTQECIEGTAPDTVEERRSKIEESVRKISIGKKLVLVDGVGYPAVGSVCGVSNGEMASLLKAPVLVVGRSGIGNAIDSFNYILAWFKQYEVQVLGGVWNKIPLTDPSGTGTAHTFERCKKYVSLYFEKNRPELGVYGFIPLASEGKRKEKEEEKAHTDDAGVSCKLRAPKKELEWTNDAEKRQAEAIMRNIGENFDVTKLVNDLDRYYAKFENKQ